jgi:hypothetical protein
VQISTPPPKVSHDWSFTTTWPRLAAVQTPLPLSVFLSYTTPRLSQGEDISPVLPGAATKSFCFHHLSVLLVTFQDRSLDLVQSQSVSLVLIKNQMWLSPNNDINILNKVYFYRNKAFLVILIDLDIFVKNCLKQWKKIFPANFLMLYKNNNLLTKLMKYKYILNIYVHLGNTQGLAIGRLLFFVFFIISIWNYSMIHVLAYFYFTFTNYYQAYLGLFETS